MVDLFAEIGFTDFQRTKNNAEGIQTLLSVMEEVEDTFVFVNLIDTDQLFGHRCDPEGYAGSLKEFDCQLPHILSKLNDDDLLIITGDHGNDPCSTSTDHSREFVPLLVVANEKSVEKELGVRATFSDIAVSVAQFFGIENTFPGSSFLKS